MDEPPASQPAQPRRSPPRWGWRWAVFLIVCAALVAGAIAIRIQDAAARQRAAVLFNTAKVQFETAARANRTPQPWRGPGGLRPFTRSEIAAVLFPNGEPRSTTTPGMWGGGDVISWFDA